MFKKKIQVSFKGTEDIKRKMIVTLPKGDNL